MKPNAAFSALHGAKNRDSRNKFFIAVHRKRFPQMLCFVPQPKQKLSMLLKLLVNLSLRYICYCTISVKTPVCTKKPYDREGFRIKSIAHGHYYSTKILKCYVDSIRH